VKMRRGLGLFGDLPVPIFENLGQSAPGVDQTARREEVPVSVEIV